MQSLAAPFLSLFKPQQTQASPFNIRNSARFIINYNNSSYLISETSADKARSLSTPDHSPLMSIKHKSQHTSEKGNVKSPTVKTHETIYSSSSTSIAAIAVRVRCPMFSLDNSPSSMAFSKAYRQYLLLKI